MPVATLYVCQCFWVRCSPFFFFLKSFDLLTLVFDLLAIYHVNLSTSGGGEIGKWDGGNWEEGERRTEEDDSGARRRVQGEGGHGEAAGQRGRGTTR